MSDYVNDLMHDSIFKDECMSLKFTRQQARDFKTVKRQRENGFKDMTNHQLCYWIQRLAKDLTDAGYGDIKFI